MCFKYDDHVHVCLIWTTYTYNIRNVYWPNVMNVKCRPIVSTQFISMIWLIHVIVARGRGSVTLKRHAQESRSSVTLERALTLERHAQESRSSVTLERALLERHAWASRLSVTLERHAWASRLSVTLERHAWACAGMEKNIPLPGAVGLAAAQWCHLKVISEKNVLH